MAASVVITIVYGLAVVTTVASAAPVQDAKPAKILALGTSLTAGFQLPQDKSFTAQLEAALREKGYEVTVVNAGVSGDTSAGGLARLNWLLGEGYTHAIVELGGNDVLRGLEPEDTRANLDAILSTLKEHDIEVLLAGMRAPPNLGPEYEKEFNGLYAELAEKHGVMLYPFFLDGVAAEPGLNLEDGIHPNEQGIARIVERMLP
ncbi:MAG: arylesterase, partial [Alphaproteobacteria bacterium]